jgi:hypothetical protein
MSAFLCESNVVRYRLSFLSKGFQKFLVRNLSIFIFVGVPVVFPIFGPPAKDDPASGVKNTMPQHGFTRKNVWKFDESSRYDTAEAAGMRARFS